VALDSLKRADRGGEEEDTGADKPWAKWHAPGGVPYKHCRVAMSHDHSAKSGWFPDLLMRLALASGIGYLAAAYTVSRWLTRRNPAGRPRSRPTPGDL